MSKDHCFYTHFKAELNANVLTRLYPETIVILSWSFCSFSWYPDVATCCYARLVSQNQDHSRSETVWFHESFRIITSHTVRDLDNLCDYTVRGSSSNARLNRLNRTNASCRMVILRSAGLGRTEALRWDPIAMPPACSPPTGGFETSLVAAVLTLSFYSQSSPTDRTPDTTALNDAF